MKENSRTDILLSPFFLLGLITLLLNDFVLKYEYSNALTGKLSDIAGLFIFPFFFAAIVPKYTKFIYGLSIVIFGYWNSSFSEMLIVALNNIDIPIGRTIDSTDFFAFAVLPFSFIHFNTQITKPRISIAAPLKTVIGFISVFSFIATTLPKQEVELDIESNKIYVLEMDKTEFFSKLNAGYGLSDTIELNLIDSLFYLHYYVQDVQAKMFVLANITEQDETTIIKLKEFLTGRITGGFFEGIDENDLKVLEGVKRVEHEGYFQRYFIDQLLHPKKESRSLYYNNKSIYDDIQKRYD